MNISMRKSTKFETNEKSSKSRFTRRHLIGDVRSIIFLSLKYTISRVEIAEFSRSHSGGPIVDDSKYL